MNRMEALYGIDRLLTGCKECEERKVRGKKGKYAQMDSYCNRHCEVGTQLQGFGKHLTVGPRRYVPEVEIGGEIEA